MGNILQVDSKSNLQTRLLQSGLTLFYLNVIRLLTLAITVLHFDTYLIVCDETPIFSKRIQQLRSNYDHNGHDL